MNIIKSQEMITHQITKLISKEYLNKLLTSGIIFNDSLIANKPSGFWLSVNNGWEDWCKTEMPDWLENTAVIEIYLTYNHNIMVIDSISDILDVWVEFVKETGFKSKYPKGDSLMSLYEKDMTGTCNFWNWLISKYDLSGIYLTKEGQWKTRMTTFLYGWDCESLVIFTDKIIKTKVLETLKQCDKELKNGNRRNK